MRVFTVPSGVLSSADISDCVSPLEVGHHDHLLLRRREPVERLEERFAVQRVEDRLGHLFGLSRWLDVEVVDVEGGKAGAAPHFAKLVDAPVVRDAHDPGGKRAALPVVGASAAPYGQEDVLCDLLGLALVPQHAQRQRVHPPPIPVIDAPQRLSVARRGALRQVRLLRRVFADQRDGSLNGCRLANRRAGGVRPFGMRDQLQVCHRSLLNPRFGGGLLRISLAALD